MAQYLSWDSKFLELVFKCVPLSTVISLYGLHLIALYSPMLYNYSTVLKEAILCKPYSDITVEIETH